MYKLNNIENIIVNHISDIFYKDRTLTHVEYNDKNYINCEKPNNHLYDGQIIDCVVINDMKNTLEKLVFDGVRNQL